MNITSLEYQEFKVVTHTAPGRNFCFARNQVCEVHMNLQGGFHVGTLAYKPKYPIRGSRLDYIPERGTLIFAFTEPSVRGGLHATWWGLVEEMDKALHDIQLFRKGKPAPKVPPILAMTDPLATINLSGVMDLAIRRAG